MVVTLVLASILCGFIGAGLAFFWGLNLLMIVLGYALGSFLGTTAIIAFVMPRFDRPTVPQKKQATKAAPQLSN